MAATDVHPKHEYKNFFSVKKLTVISGIIIVIVATSVLAISNSMADSDKVIYGVTCEGDSLGGLTKSQLQKHFMQIASKKMHNLTFHHQDQIFEISPQEINLQPEIDIAIKKVMNLGRDGSIISNLKDQIQCLLFGRDIFLTAEYDNTLLEDKLNAIAKQINKDPVNAYIRFGAKESIEKIPSVDGEKINVSQLSNSLKEPLTTLNLPKDATELKTEIIQPFMTTEDIATIDSVLGAYSTYYYPDDRGDNIALAANSISEKLLRPSWTFSFNDTVGKRTEKNGYKKAGVIISGKADVDYGGGVCQVSSTLYNAALLAGMTITVRSPHYFQSNYIGFGRDATVADDLIDFQFRNDLPHNVYLIMHANGSKITAYVLGTQADLNGLHASLELSGKSLYRVWYNDDNEIVTEEYLHTDSYHSPNET